MQDSQTVESCWTVAGGTVERRLHLQSLIAESESRSIGSIQKVLSSRFYPVGSIATAASTGKIWKGRILSV